MSRHPRYHEGQVLLVRHGQTPLNAAGRLRGRLDPPLSGAGFRQVRALARDLARRHPRRIVTGPLLRTVQTAEFIAREASLELVIDDDLQDRDYGVWAGQLQTVVIERWGALDNAPGVESATAVRERAVRALNDQLPFLGSRPVVMVSHDAVISQLLSFLDPTLGSADDIRQRTGCFNELRCDGGGGWSVQLVDQLPSVLGGHP